MSTVRVGIGGWDFAPWRGLFYPDGLRKADQLGYATARLTSIEINATFYRTQSAKTFRNWRDGTPEGFVFAVKAARAAAQRTDAEEAKPAVARFLGSGLTELGDKLGPILWQIPARRRFDPDALARFLDLLPPTLDGLPLRHALEAEHESFLTEAALTRLSERNIALVMLDKPGVKPCTEPTADHVYLRLQGTVDAEPAGYPPTALDDWATRLRSLANSAKGEVFAYVISGAKHRAPAAAIELIARLRKE